jgi:hypothetical protein
MSATEQARYIYSRFGTRQVADLLQSIFAGELLQPSVRLWIVSPWISDIPIIDNRANSFSSIVPAWSRTQVRLSVVLLRLLESGSVVHIATRGDESHNTEFISRMRDRAAGHPRLRLHLTSELHDKGILGDGFYLAGSMNFTYSGISVNQEALHFSVDQSVVAQHQVTFRARWPE